MKSKTTTAVLLSLLAVAGLAVNDAYAQSNTERLVSIDTNVEGIAADTDVLGTMVSAIQDTLSGMADTLTGIMNAITGVQTSVDSVAMDVTQMNSKIAGIETTLMGLSGLDDRLASIDSRINNLASDDEMNDQILQVLTSTVTNTNDRLEQVINKLDAIQVGLESANIKIAEIETAPTKIPSGDTLFSSESELNVNSYHYNQYGDPTTDRGANFYELEMTFACTNDVYVETVELFLDPVVSNPYQYMSRYASPPGPSAAEWADVLNNYVWVDGRELYNNKFSTGGGNYAELKNKALDFDNQILRAGDRLQFESVLYEGEFVKATGVHATQPTSSDGTTTGAKGGDPLPTISDANNEYLIYNSNKTKRGDPGANNALYEINVEWRSLISGTTCSINFGSGSAVTPGLTQSDVLVYSVTKNPAHGERTIKDFEDEIDCGGDPVEITRITADTIDRWLLPQHSHVVLTVGTQEYELDFDEDVTTHPVFMDEDIRDALPLVVGNENLVISGSILVDSLLLSVHYDTIPNARCAVIPGY